MGTRVYLGATAPCALPHKFRSQAQGCLQFRVGPSKFGSEQKDKDKTASHLQQTGHKQHLWANKADPPKIFIEEINAPVAETVMCSLGPVPSSQNTAGLHFPASFAARVAM